MSVYEMDRCCADTWSRIMNNNNTVYNKKTVKVL